MPKIQLYERAVSIPDRAGGEISVQPVQDFGKFEQLSEIGKSVQKIGARLGKSLAQRELAAARQSATLRTNLLVKQLTEEPDPTSVSRTQKRSLPIMEGGLIVAEEKGSLYEPGAALAAWGVESQAIKDDILQGLGWDLTVRDNFEATWAELSTKAQVAIHTKLLKRMRSDQLGSLWGELNNYIKMAGTADAAGRADIIVSGEMSIDSAVQHNLLMPEDGAKEKIKFRKSVAKAGIDNYIRRAGGDEKDKYKLSQLLDNMEEDDIPAGEFGEIAEYWGMLDGTEKLALQNKVATKLETLLNIEDKMDIRNAARIRRNQGQKLGEMLKRIILDKIKAMADLTGDPPDGEDPVAAGEGPLTQMVAIEALESGQISQEGYNKIVAALSGIDPPSDDGAFVVKMIKEISAAESKEDLDEIIGRALAEVNPTGKLTLATYHNFVSMAVAAEAKTPMERNKKSYRAALISILGEKGLFAIFGGEEARSATVLLQFETSLQEGVDPEVAFQNAVNTFSDIVIVDLNKFPRPLLGPSKPLEEYTLDDVTETIERTQEKFEGRAGTLVIQMRLLRALEAFLIKKGAAPPAQENVKPTDAENLDKLRGRR